VRLVDVPSHASSWAHDKGVPDKLRSYSSSGARLVQLGRFRRRLGSGRRTGGEIGQGIGEVFVDNRRASSVALTKLSWL
jgi:hypothetical protein